jgi:CRP-like cAMP-binding protein
MDGVDASTGADAGTHVDLAGLRQLLQRAPAFRGLPPEEIDAIAQRFRARNVAAGEIVVRQGDPGDELFLVEDGELEAGAEMQGRRVRLGLLHPGDIFGEMTPLRGTPRTATVTALRPARLWSLSAAALRETLSRTPALEANLREVIRRRDLANALRALQ